MNWDEYRRLKLRSYINAKERGEVDRDIIPLLDLINSFKFFVTTSSCSGRIGILDMPEFGDKINAEFLGKWHSPVNFDDVLNAVRGIRRDAWLIMFPPIIHVACENLKVAEKLMAIANNAGFRRCGIISLKNNIVEISSLERMEVPIAVKGKLIVDMNSLRLMIEIANRKLERSKKKLDRLYDHLKNFERILST